jgi:hypothetical protein
MYFFACSEINVDDYGTCILGVSNSAWSEVDHSPTTYSFHRNAGNTLPNKLQHCWCCLYTDDV